MESATIKSCIWRTLRKRKIILRSCGWSNPKEILIKSSDISIPTTSENISLKSIAAQFYMNPVYLGRLFRKSYNQYFNEYLLNLRIQEAQKLLRQTDLRMYEVAARIGFQNADYFCDPV